MSAPKSRAVLQPAMEDASPVDGRPKHCPTGKAPAKSRLWWWVVVAFLIQFAAWAVWFKIAASAQVQDVPLAESR